MNKGLDKAIQLVLKHEGGYVNHPEDPGGETKYGISKRAYPDVDIANLTEYDARCIYKKDYWDKVKGDELPAALALVVFDTAVNMGIRRAVKFLQETVNAQPIDGIIGPITISNACKAFDHPEFIIDSYLNKRIKKYQSLSTFKTFGKGWIRRVEDIREHAKELV